MTAQVVCPRCLDRVLLTEVPSRLPIVVPEHLDDQMVRCSGVGRRSSKAWMLRPEQAVPPSAQVRANGVSGGA